MDLKCFEDNGGHKRFRVTKTSTDNSDLGSQLAPIKLNVIHYLQNLDTAFRMHTGLNAINFYRTKDDYDNDVVLYMLDLSAYDSYHTVRDVMKVDGLSNIDDPILGLYMSFIVSDPLLVGQPHEVELQSDHLVSDHIVQLAQLVTTHINAAQNLAATGSANNQDILNHLQNAVDTLGSANDSVNPVSEKSIFSA